MLFFTFWIPFLLEEAPPAAPTNPITVAYSWAQLISTLTDRALWLFFLGLILGIAWWIDRRKDRQLDDYRKWERDNAERQAKLIESNTACMEDLKEEMRELKEIMIRVERRLDR